MFISKLSGYFYKMNQQRIASILLALFFAIITFNSQNQVFFGDMVQLGSRHAHFFFNNHFSSWWLPTTLDSGHPPIFGMYMALCWQLFRKSLVVSHWAMFPFLILIAFAIPRLIKNFVQSGSLVFMSLLLFFEPTLRAQASLTSPDIVLIAFFLWALVFYIEQKNKLLLLALIPMSFISMRGMMLLFALYLATISHQYITNKKQSLTQWLNLTLIFTPAVLLCFYWLFRHYQLTGWIGFHSDSPWASSFQTVGITQVLKNLCLMVWRFIDFGRITVFLFLLGFALYQFRKKDSIKSNQLFLILLFVFLFLVYSANTLFADGLVGHRYYLPIYLIVLLLVVQWIENYFPSRAGIFTSMIAFSFIFGSMYVYPNKIAMGWDATPAHRPYYKLRTEAIAYLEKNNIAINNVAAGFPSLDSREYLELNGDTSRFQSYHLNNTKYILWSNIFNYPDELQDSLGLKKVVFEKEKDGVFMKIVER
jgi:hypothetical protein